MANPQNKYVFIVTYGRSGSTLLQSVLQSIDGYFIRGENMNALQGLYHSFQRAEEARYDHGMSEVPPHGPWFGANEIDPEAYGAALAKVFVDHIIQPPADARVIGFKEIRFHEGAENAVEPFLLFIAKFFSPARFIFNTRNWEDVSKSSWWATMKPERVREIVEKCDRQYTDFARKYPNLSHLVCYDDIKGKPEKLEPLFDFLGEPFDLARISDVTERRLKHK